MNGIDKRKFDHPVISFLGIFIAYMYSFGYGWLSLTIKAVDLRTRYVAFVFLGATVCAIIAYFAISGFKTTKREFVSMLVLICYIVAIFFVGEINGGISTTANDTMKEFVVKVVPAVFIAMALSRYRCIDDLISWVDFFEVITTVGLMRFLAEGIGNGISRAQMETYFGWDYQGISYLAAYMFVLNIFMILVGTKRIHYGIFSEKICNIIRIICAVIQFFASMYSGGRGGFVLILISIYFFVLYYSSVSKKIFPIVLLAIGTLALVWGLTFLAVKFSFFDAGLDRIFAFVGNNGIDWSGTSGRGDIYVKALALIKASPAWGYGITGGSYFGVSQSHNLFLDILVEGGIIYLIAVITILVLFAKKLKRLIKYDNAYMLILALFFGDFINLMFSSIYLRTTAIWLALFFVFNIREEDVYENWDVELS